MTGLKDGLQELKEFWLGTLELWFRKTGQQESFLSLPFCFYLIFPLFPFLSLLLSHSIKLWSGKTCLPTFDLVFLAVCWGSVLLESAELYKRTMSGCLLCCSPLCRQRGGPATVSDSNRKAFISSTCHDPGTASPSTISQ